MFNRIKLRDTPHFDHYVLLVASVFVNSYVVWLGPTTPPQGQVPTYLPMQTAVVRTR